MESTVKKWGNSLGLRVPKNIANRLNISDGTHVQLEIQGETIQLTPIHTTSELDTLCKRINQSNTHSEVDTGIFVGNEQW